jgi:putative PIN family toxin of toxin-antitoxin system
VIPRAVVDTNVFISGALSPGSTPSEVLRAAGQAFRLVWSAGIVAECLRVLAYPRVERRLRAGGDEEDARVLLARLAAGADMVAAELLPRIRVVTADPSDDLFLATAIAGGARVLVSGDKRHLLPLREVSGVRIVDPATFAAELGLPGAPRGKGPAESVHEPVAGYPVEDAVMELAREAQRWARAGERRGTAGHASRRSSRKKVTGSMMLAPR